jgi:poly(A) polymerase
VIWRDRYALPERWQAPRFPLSGADVVALGVAPGPRVGELLRAVEDGWVAGDFAADDPALRAELQRMVAQA